MATANVFSGARARLKVNGINGLAIVGYASGVSGSETIDYEPVDTLALLEVKEFVPTAYRSTLSAQVFRIVGNSLKAQGIFPRENNILTSGDLVVSIEDVLTGATVQQFQEVKCSEHSFDITARGIVSENVNFVCIRVLSEDEL